MNAARDGVDRFGSPLPSVASVASRATSPPPGAGPQGDAPATGTNLNENLKNIGKFFRRDMTGFGRFGRAAEEGKG